MQKLSFKLPTPLMFAGGYKFWRSEIEYEKSKLIALSLGQPEPNYKRPENDVLVSASVFAKEVGVSSRTLTRRIAEHRANGSAEI